MTKEDLIRTAIKTCTGKTNLSEMTKVDYYKMMATANEDVLLIDDLNPAFILSGISNSLLGLIAKGEINMKDLAKHTLKGRGYDENGIFVGFKS